ELRKIADEVKPSSRFTSSATIKPHQHIKEALTALRQVHRTPDNEIIIQKALVYGDALRDQLHRVRKQAKSWKFAHQYTPLSIRKVPRQTYLRFNNAQAILRANLTPRSAIFRHALRLGVALAL